MILSERLITDNDIVVPKGWMRPIVEVLREIPSAGPIGLVHFANILKFEEVNEGKGTYIEKNGIKYLAQRNIGGNYLPPPRGDLFGQTGMSVPPG